MRLLHNILFGMLWGLGKVLGALPLKMQHALADFLYVIIYHIAHYRVKVTRMNLKNAFPEKGEAERLKIEKRFYRHLATLFIEDIAMVAFSAETMRKRFIYENLDEFLKMNDRRTVIAAMSHFGNWEYTTGFSLVNPHPILAVYHPLKSQASDKFFHRMRSRFGVEPLPMKHVFRTMIARRNDNSVLALIADQTPPRTKENRWIQFLNQPTLFFLGMEQLALRQHMAIFFLHVRQEKRGYYIGHLEMIYDGEEKVEPFEITRRYRTKLQAMIEETPHLWVWSHKRWKHQKFDDQEVLD